MTSSQALEEASCSSAGRVCSCIMMPTANAAFGHSNRLSAALTYVSSSTSALELIHMPDLDSSCTRSVLKCHKIESATPPGRPDNLQSQADTEEHHTSAASSILCSCNGGGPRTTAWISLRLQWPALPTATPAPRILKRPHQSCTPRPAHWHVSSGTRPHIQVAGARLRYARARRSGLMISLRGPAYHTRADMRFRIPSPELSIASSGFG